MILKTSKVGLKLSRIKEAEKAGKREVLRPGARKEERRNHVMLPTLSSLHIALWDKTRSF